MRLDIERRLHLGPHEVETICGWLNEVVDDVSAVVVSDYAKGMLIPVLVRQIIDIARSRGVWSTPRPTMWPATQARP